MKYSVIIPVYNAEKTLARCLDSLMPQLRDDIEILLINDGSADDSDTVCREYAERCPNIRYMVQENQGVSYARNSCLDAASGEYILFVDSDDYVSNRYFERLDHHLSVSQADLLLFGSLRGKNSKRICTGEIILHDDIKIAEYAGTLLIRQRMYPVWNKVFRRSIIERHHLRFMPHLRIGEDVAFVVPYLLKIEHFASTNDCLYTQDISSSDSLSRKKKEYIFEHLQKANEVMLNAIEQSSWTKPAKKTLRASVIYLSYRSVYSTSKELLKYSSLSARERKIIIRKICSQFIEKKIRPESWKCRLLALPVQLRMAGVIDLMTRLADWRRKHHG